MNFVEFPDITPSSMDFTPPRFPVGSDTSLGGVTSRRKFGNRPSEGRLQVEFRNISNFTCSQILLACIQSRGLAPIAFKESFFLGAGPDLKPYLDCSAYPGLLWFFIEESPPRINRVEGGSEVSNMSLELAAKLLPQGAQGTVGPIVFPTLPSITPPPTTIKDFLYDIEVDPSQPLQIGDSSRPGSDGTTDKWRSLSLLMNEPNGLARIGSNGLIPDSLLPNSLNLSVSQNVGLQLSSTEDEYILTTTYNTQVGDTEQSFPVGGAPALAAAQWKQKNIVQVLDTILFPEVPPPDQGIKSRTLVTGTTAVLANNSPGSVEIESFPTYALISVHLSHPSRCRIYSDNTSRANDAGRSIGSDPTPGSGLIAEVVSIQNNYQQKVTPFVVGGNLDTPVGSTMYLSVTNLSGATRAIVVTITLLQLEL